MKVTSPIFGFRSVLPVCFLLLSFSCLGVYAADFVASSERYWAGHRMTETTETYNGKIWELQLEFSPSGERYTAMVRRLSASVNRPSKATPLYEVCQTEGRVSEAGVLSVGKCPWGRAITGVLPTIAVKDSNTGGGRSLRTKASWNLRKLLALKTRPKAKLYLRDDFVASSERYWAGHWMTETTETYNGKIWELQLEFSPSGERYTAMVRRLSASVNRPSKATPLYEVCQTEGRVSEAGVLSVGKCPWGRAITGVLPTIAVKDSNTGGGRSLRTKASWNLRKLLALKTRPKAKLYLRDVKAFQQANPGVLDAVLIARVYEAAELEVDSGNHRADDSKFSELARHTAASIAFGRFELARVKARENEELDKRKTLLGLLAANVAFIKERLNTNPFSKNARRLEKLLSEYEKTPEGLDSTALGERSEKLAQALEQLDLQARRTLVEPPASVENPLRNAFLALSLSNRKDVQRRLKERGHYKSGIDGVYGRGTQAALHAYASETRTTKFDGKEAAVAFMARVLALPKSAYETPESAKTYLEDIKAFQKANPVTLDALLLARVYEAAALEVERGNHQADDSKFSQLARHTDESIAFGRFESARNKARENEEREKRKTLLGLLAANVANIQEKLKADPFSEKARWLEQLLSEYAKTPQGLDSVALSDRNQGLVQALEQLDLQAMPRTNSTPAAVQSLPTTEFRHLLEPVYAKTFLEDVKTFGSLNPGVLDPILIAEHFSAASSEVKRGHHKSAGSSYLKITQMITKNSKFSAYHKEQNATRARRLKDKKAELIAIHEKLLQSAHGRIAANPFAPEAPQLVLIVSENKAFKPESSDIEGLQLQLKKFEKALNELGIKGDGTETEPTPNSTALDLSGLSDIGQEDTAFLVNVGGDGRHAYRDLAGKVAFERKRAVVCAPALVTLGRQHSAFVRDQLVSAWKGHSFNFIKECTVGYEGVDAVLVTGADLADGSKLPSADKTANRLEAKTLERKLVVKALELKRELVKREILSEQYRGDILDEIRSGFGGVSFQGNLELGCIADLEDLRGHAEALAAVSKAHLFESGVSVKTTAQFSAKDAFIKAQRGRCAYIYGAAPVLKQIIAAADRASLITTVLPVWLTEAEIANRKAADMAQVKAKRAAEAKRKAALKRAQSEAVSAAQTLALRNETRQQEYRARYGAKVATLVAALNLDLKKARDAVDLAFEERRNTSDALAEHQLWKPFPSWYAKRRARGWLHVNSLASPRDYGLVRWKGRDVEAIFGDIRIMMKNANIGEYSEHCWTVGVVNDVEFQQYREPLVVQCDDIDAFEQWRSDHHFQTRWDLGLRE